MDARIEPGSVWKEADPRVERYVRILAAPDGQGGISRLPGFDGFVTLGKVMIQKIDIATLEPCAGARPTAAKPERFNGKRGGYSLHSSANLASA